MSYNKKKFIDKAIGSYSIVTVTMFFQSNDFLHFGKLSSMEKIDGNIWQIWKDLEFVCQTKECLSVQIFFQKNVNRW